MLIRPTAFSTPLLSGVLRWVARAVLRCAGWRVVGERPAASRYVLIGAPHTSNWDFPLMLAVILSSCMDVHWMGKHTLFRPPLGRLMRWLGGIPIDRARPANRVQLVAELFDGYDDLVVLIAPEGTRSDVAEWKSGFYHIARAARVPILLGYIDAKRRECGFGPLFEPSGDIDGDMRRIREFYADKTGLRNSIVGVDDSGGR